MIKNLLACFLYGAFIGFISVAIVGAILEALLLGLIGMIRRK